MSALERRPMLESQLPQRLDELAAPQLPDYADDLLARTAATRQRPRWTFAERWLPMGVIARERLSPLPVPLRQIVVIVLLVATALVASALLAGSTRTVPPFGPAANGMLAFDENGDIYVVDRIDGQPRLVVSGQSNDFAPGFTRDGTRLTFLRESAEPGAVELWMAGLDGSDQRALTPPLENLDWGEFSADDSMVAIQAKARPNPAALFIGQVGDPRSLTKLDLKLVIHKPTYRGPDGREIVFRGADGDGSGLFAVRSDGTGLRPLTAQDGDVVAGYMDPQVSQDGRFVAYHVWNDADQRSHLYLLDIDAGTTRGLDLEHARINEAYAVFSPVGDVLAYHVINAEQTSLQVKVAPLDGSWLPRPVGPAMTFQPGLYGGHMAFSPDGSKILVSSDYSRETRVVAVATGGEGTVIPWAPGGAGWQRLAP